MMKLFFLAGAVVSICIAHFIRAARWQLFIEIYEEPQKRNLLQSLSAGYLLNYLFPYKLGDIFRAWASGRKMKNGKALGFSTVIVDRYLDVVFVGIIFIFLVLRGSGDRVIKESALFYTAAAAVLLVVTVLAYMCRDALKKTVMAAASLFNVRIEAFLLRFSWALIWNFKDIYLKIHKGKLLFATVGMWAFYLLSYILYGAYLSLGGYDVSWEDVFTVLFEQNGIKASTVSISLWANVQGEPYPYGMAVYMLLPLLVLLLLSMCITSDQNTSCTEGCINLLPHLDPGERLAFLENYFSTHDQEYVASYLKINQSISIIRDYSAGSNAKTMLCMDEEGIFFRKYAFGTDGEKLYQQIVWIEENKDVLKLPEILRQAKDGVCCYYDMPYSSDTVGLFEYIHCMPADKGWDMLRLVLGSLERSIYQTNVRRCDKAAIHKYVEDKVKRNLDKIRHSKRIKALLQYEAVIINGTAYRNLQFYERYLTEDYLQEIFEDDTYAVIHGDLTIENIICMRGRDGNDSFYLIDPNTGNVHDSPNLDYGKLLQSIHGGYEFLMSVKEVKITANRIDFLFTRSSAYMELHKRLRDHMQEHFGSFRTRSIYFHEIVHWLRLMPYKIEKDDKRACLFYAGMLIVMSDVIDMFGGGYSE